MDVKYSRYDNFILTTGAPEKSDTDCEAARLFPSAIKESMRELLTFTIANSATTKNAVKAIKTITILILYMSKYVSLLTL